MVIRRPVISGSSSAGRLSSAVSDIPMPRYFHYAGNYSGWNVGFLFFFLDSHAMAAAGDAWEDSSSVQ